MIPPLPPPDDDRNLVQFLQQHRPQPPAATPDLEDSILTAIAQSKVVRYHPRQSRWFRSAWVPTAIAASLVVGLLSYRSLMPSPSKPADMQSLEAFMETSWDSSMNDDSSDDGTVFAANSLLPISDPPLSADRR